MWGLWIKAAASLCPLLMATCYTQKAICWDTNHQLISLRFHFQEGCFQLSCLMGLEFTLCSAVAESEMGFGVGRGARGINMERAK